MEYAMLRRTERLVGNEAMNNISSKRVIIFGVGGVGSWCAESLVRTGIRHLTIVDSDRVCATNCNRQLMATSRTIGEVKVDAMKRRLQEINPDAEVTALQMIYEAANAEYFHIESYDYVIDAIDSLKDKAHLILHATALAKQIRQGELTGEGVVRRLTFISSMGAALRIDPTQIRVAEFWKVRNDTLGKALRKRFKHNKQMPASKFMCVYSEELPMENRGEDLPCGLPECICAKAKLQQNCAPALDTPPSDSSTTPLPDSSATTSDAPAVPSDHNWNASKAQINGSLSHITAIFGFTIAGLVIQDIINEGKV